MIHLEHAEGGIRIPIRERVEARAEDDVLPNSGGDRACQRVLRHTTPDRKERTQALRDGSVLETMRLRAQRGGLRVADDHKRQRIVVDAGVIQQLVRRATEGNPLGRPARPDHPGFGACQLRRTGCSMLTRLPSVSVTK